MAEEQVREDGFGLEVGKRYPSQSDLLRFINAADPIVLFFDSELRFPDFSDGDARIEFYTLAHGLVGDLQTTLLETLEGQRPHVARYVKMELDLL